MHTTPLGRLPARPNESLEVKRMASKCRPAPRPPFQREDGRWTFYDYPGGIQTEGGYYSTEDEAKQAYDRVYRIWFANKGCDGPVNAVID